MNLKLNLLFEDFKKPKIFHTIFHYNKHKKLDEKTNDIRKF